MAIRTKKSFLGNVRGKVSDIVLSASNGVEIVKSTPQKIKKNKITAYQTAERDSFKVITRFLKFKDNKQIFNQSFQVRKNEHLSPWNVALSMIRLDAMTGSYPDYHLDLTKLKFSRPLRTTQTGWNSNFAEKDRNLVVQWELNPFPLKATQLDDEAIVIFYSIKYGGFVIRRSVRSILNYTLPPYNSLQGHDIFCWLFFISADGKLVSETQYLGMLTMPALIGPKRLVT